MATIRQVDKPATFEIIIKRKIKPYWMVSIRDITDSYKSSVWFRTRGKCGLREALKLALSECANNEGIITLIRFNENIPILKMVFAAHYVFGYLQYQLLV